MIPIFLHPQNPHYFLFRSEPTVLVTSGEHYGAVLNRDFATVPYLEELHSKGLNLTRIFTGAYVEDSNSFNISRNTLGPAPGRFLCPWARSSTPGYVNGGKKFDLNEWDGAYFRRLKEFLREAQKRGIVVELSLFCPYYEESMWDLSPLNAKNNVNGVGDMPRNEVLTLRHSELVAVQERMVRKVVEELKEFDNLYYEICNEPYFGGVTLEWQRCIASVIADAEKGFPAKHLIAQNIANGSQKIEDPDPNVSIFNFHYASPPDTVGLNYGLNRVIGFDETGFKGTADATYRKEAWEFLFAGGGVFDHLDYSFTVSHEKGDYAYPPSQPGGGSAALRSQLGILTKFFRKLDFVRMKPDNSFVKEIVPSITSTGDPAPDAPKDESKGAVSFYGLAEPGKAYAVYINSGKPVGRVEMNLPDGRYRVDWVDPLTGSVVKTEELKPDGAADLTAPSNTGEIALRLVNVKH